MPEEVVNPSPEQEKQKKEPMQTATGSLRVKIIPYPKIVFFWPTFIFSLLCGAFSLMIGPNSTLGLMFIIVFTFNLLVISFEFSRIKFIATAMGFVMVILALFLTEAYDIHVFAWLKTFIRGLDLLANHVFYFAVSVVFALIYSVVFITTRWNYWVIEPNEVLHYLGFMGDVHRYPAPNLKMSKEISDIFEYFLGLSGTLILSPTSESRDIVLENVLFVNKKEERIKNLLSSIQVKIRH